MHKILQKKKLAENTYQMDILAPEVAVKAKAGQFVMVRIDEKGERIPLTIADNNKKSITVVFQVVGKTTKDLEKLKKGNFLLDIAGPLGNPTHIENYGNVCLVAGGLGIAPLYPIAKAMKEAKNNVFVIIGARNKKLLFWEDNLKKVSDRMMICTDDGSKGKKGLVTDALRDLMYKRRLNFVFTVGPPVMMKFVALTTKQLIRTFASINSIMVDGIGMCGGCRVKVGKEIKFSCVDGPDFNAHDVNWDELLNRNGMYIDEEKHACKCKR